MPNPAPARRVPAVLAGIFAMAASLAAMATVVVSDLAWATEPAVNAQLADEVPAPVPVKLAKIEHKVTPVEEPVLLDVDDPAPTRPMKKLKKQRRMVDFGNFEGY